MDLGTYRFPGDLTPLFGPDFCVVLRNLLAWPGKHGAARTYKRSVLSNNHDEPHDRHPQVNMQRRFADYGSAGLRASISSRYMWPSWIRYSVAQSWGGCRGQRQQGGDAKGPGPASFQTFGFLWIFRPPRRSRRGTCDYLHPSLSKLWCNFFANFLSAFAAFCLVRLVAGSECFQ